MSQDIKELLREVLTDELTGLRIELSDFRKEVTVRFEEVNGQFENVIGRLANLEKGQKSIEQRISTIPAQYQALEDSLGGSTKAFESNQKKQQALIELLSFRSISNETEIKELRKLI